MWMTIGKTALQVLISMASSLLTESFLKHAVVIGLEKVVKRTGSDTEAQLLAAAKQAWGMTDGK